MRPCLTLLSGCSEGERRGPVTHWDVTHTCTQMHAHTHLDPYLSTHTNTKKILISIFFISHFLYLTPCCYSFTKLAVAAPKQLTEYAHSQQFATKHHYFSVSYLFGGWMGKLALSFWRDRGHRCCTFLSSIISFTAINRPHIPLSTALSLHITVVLVYYWGCHLPTTPRISGDSYLNLSIS